MAGRLAGRSVVVTRTAEQSVGLADLLIAEGAAVVTVPLIIVVDAPDGGAALEAALARIDQYDWIVVTSPNAASRVARAIDARDARRPKVAAVGTATAALLPVVDLVPARQRAAGLLDELPEGPGRVLLPHSAQAHATLADGLRERGWEVDEVDAYDVISRAPEDHERAAVAGADALVLASGTAARAWVEAFGPRSPALVVAIGPQTASAAAEVGLKVHLTSSDHSPAGLVEALVAHLRGP
jgi:uroporphyrinogen-III synthase